MFPPAQRGLGLALMAMVANVAAALGPPIGGVLVEFAGWPFDAGWHWIFLINVPIGVLGIALALRTVPETRDPYAGTAVDWWGMVTLGAAIFCLTFGLVEGERLGLGLAADRGAVRRARSSSPPRSRSRSATASYPMLTRGARPQPSVRGRLRDACCCSGSG